MHIPIYIFYNIKMNFHKKISGVISTPIVTMLTIVITIDCLNAYSTPVDGQFFYSKIQYKSGQVFIDMGVGSEN